MDLPGDTEHFGAGRLGGKAGDDVVVQVLAVGELCELPEDGTAARIGDT
ncbi:hypothetical protein ACWGJV_37260 [Streptomyces tendae]